VGEISGCQGEMGEPGGFYTFHDCLMAGHGEGCEDQVRIQCRNLLDVDLQVGADPRKIFQKLRWMVGMIVYPYQEVGTPQGGDDLRV